MMGDFNGHQITDTSWTSLYEPHHAKTGPKIFFVVISKEGLASSTSAKVSFGMTPTKITPVAFKDCTLQSASYQKKAWLK